jgi:hypothetical protein
MLRKRPPRMNHERTGSQRKGSNISNVGWRIGRGFLRILTQRAGNKNQVDGASGYVLGNLIEVVDFAAAEASHRKKCRYRRHSAQTTSRRDAHLD